MYIISPMQSFLDAQGVRRPVPAPVTTRPLLTGSEQFEVALLDRPDYFHYLGVGYSRRDLMERGWPGQGSSRPYELKVMREVDDANRAASLNKRSVPETTLDHFDHTPEDKPVNDYYGFELGSIDLVREIPLSSQTVAIRSGGGVRLEEFPNGGGVVPAQVGGAIVPISSLVGRLGGTLGQRVTAWAIGAAAGSRLAWGSLPSWLRSAMALIGLSGATIAIDNATEGPIQIRPFGGGGAGRELDIQVGNYYDGRIITKTWLANGIQFWATGLTRADRMHHVLKLDGSIKSWKPPRPVVLMAGGAKNIRDLLRADDIIDKQLRKVKKAIGRRATPTPRKPKGPAQVVIVDPQHAALHS